MSRAKKARLMVTNDSGQSCESRHQLFRLGFMTPSQFLGLFLQLNRMLENGIISMPLGEVLPPHEGSVLGGAAVVMPEIEIEKINRFLERLACQHAVFPETFDDFARFANLGV